MGEKKKVSNKTAIIIIVTIIILAILYFLFFVVDIVSYIKNYDYMQEAGQRANALHEEIQENANEFNTNRKEHEERVQNIKDKYGIDE